MSRSGEKFAMVFLGALAGATVALLIAPQTGEKTRRQIAKYGKKAGSRAQKFVGEIADAMDDVLGDVLTFSGNKIEKGKELTSRAHSEILEVLDAGKKYIEDERAKLDKIFK